jgi:hypothetical protein
MGLSWTKTDFFLSIIFDAMGITMNYKKKLHCDDDDILLFIKYFSGMLFQIIHMVIVASSMI